MATDPLHDLAILCRDKLKESFPEIDCTIDEHDVNIHFSLRISRKPKWLLIIRFFEDHVRIFSRRLENWGRKVLYSDPKFMDTLLSELRLAW